MRVGLYLAAAASVVIPDGVYATPTRAERIESDRTLYAFAKCIASSRDRRKLVRFLAFAPTAQGADKVGRATAFDTCLTVAGTLTFRAPLFRAALYDALYRRDFGKSDILPTRDQARLDFRSEVSSDSEADAATFVATRTFGDCVSRLDPVAVRRLLLVEIDSNAEDAAFAQLVPTMGRCLADGQLRFGRQMLRGFLAEALYKLTVAAPAPGRPLASASAVASASRR